MGPCVRHANGWVCRATGAVAIGLLALGGAVIASPLASAAGTGYAPGTAPHTGATAPGLHGKVVKVCTLQPAGGPCAATIGDTSITASVTSGTFAVPTTCVVTDADSTALAGPGGAQVVVAFGFGCYQNGTKLTGSFSPPVLVTVSSPQIVTGSKVYFRESTELEAVTASVTSGKATFPVNEDPTVEVTAPTVALTGATTVHTGEPFALEGAIADLLVLAGSVLIGWLALRRRRT